MEHNSIPVCQKLYLTVEEAAAYSGIGQQKIRELMKQDDCNFVLKVGVGKQLIRRNAFEKYLSNREHI